MLFKLMFLLPLSSLFFSLFSLTLTVNMGREAGNDFSTIHIKENLEFTCISETDEFSEIKQIQCVFPREPKEKFEKMQTNFFKIDSFSRNKRYYVRILPVEKMKLLPIPHKLHEKDPLYAVSEYTSSKHWMVIGYKESLPLVKMEKTPPMGINFPVEMKETAKPFVGALDISGAPIHLDQVRDVADYMRIKSAYESGNYDQLAKDVDNLFTRYPDTIFKAELLLYKMRGFHHTDENEALLEVSKEFIREYSDDENMPEVLAYTANAYSSVGLQADGSYFYERLFKEFPTSKYAALGMVFLGDQYLSSGKIKDATSYFEKALYLTQDVEVASMAAIRLAKISLDHGEVERAAELYEKIIEGNGKYLLHDIVGNYDNARAFSNRKQQKVAADILTCITDHLPPGDDRYEAMIKDIGLWLSETADKAAAYKALKRYQNTFGESDYTAEVQEALDSLFYTPEDANSTALLAEYEDLESKYANQEIGNKASLQKAKLLYSEKKYQDVLDMQGSGAEKEEGFESVKHDAAHALVLGSLETGECARAIQLSKEHNISIEQSYDNKLYECAYMTGNYTLANTTSKRHLKDKDKRLQWLYNYAKTLYKLGEYEELVKVSEDVMTLSEIEETTAFDMILHDTFYAHERLGDDQGMVRTIKELEKRRGLVYDDIELYVSMVKLGLKEKDDVMIQTYAEKIMQLQDKTGSYSQSPFVEFAALQVLKNQNKDSEQLELLRSVLQRELKAKDKSRAEYMMGSLLMKKGDKEAAKAAFEESMKADEKSAWASLSKDALELIE